MKLVNLDILPRGPAEAAGYWVMRLDSPDCSPTDRAAFEAWRAAHGANKRAYARAQRALAVVDRHLGSLELTDLGTQVFKETRTPRRSSFRFAAAGLAVACTLIVGVVFYQQDRIVPATNQQVVAGETGETSNKRFETAVGERSTVTLSDDSIVTLNTNSLIELHFTEDSEVRRLVLARGQAHFKVEKDPRPFEVLAGDHRIVALGTAFDIQLYDERGVQVTLVEGRVSVDEVMDGTGQIEIPATGEPFIRTELVAGEQLIALAHKTPKVVKADVERVTGWRDGLLVFRDEPLRDAVREINRYSTKKLFVDDDQRLDNIDIGGVFMTGSTRTFVTALVTVYPVEARYITYDRIELYWRDTDFITTEVENPTQK